MKLSTRSRYGTRIMLDLAQHYGEGPVPLRDISKRQRISEKYLGKLVIPLLRAKYIKTVRGSKGGHLLAKPPKEVTVGEIVELLEGGINLTHCIKNPDVCDRSSSCLTRGLWKEATKAMCERLDSVTLSELMKRGKSS